MSQDKGALCLGAFYLGGVMTGIPQEQPHKSLLRFRKSVESWPSNLWYIRGFSLSWSLLIDLDLTLVQ